MATRGTTASTDEGWTMMLQTIEGIYRDGKVELAAQPANVTEARVMVIFLPVELVAVEQDKPVQEPEEARRAARQRLLARLEQGISFGGPPYPRREELYDRVYGFDQKDG
ncbi:MAG TPA: hypothetical protein VF590_12155 [Isosphaeraceae bacterium]|jgi:hypothetical protein